MAENSKDISEQGAKIRAGMLLSQYIRVIAQEIVDINDEDGPKTKAEVLSRMIWDKALGGDKTMITLIFERMEGRAGLATGKDPRSRFPIADKVSQKGKKKLNEIAESSDKA